MTRRTKTVGARLTPGEIEVLETLASMLGLAPSGALAALAPGPDLAEILAAEAPAAGGLAAAIERLVAEGILARLQAVGVVDADWVDDLRRNPRFCFELWRRRVVAEVDRILPRPAETLAERLNDLRSDDIITRISAGKSLAESIGVGLKIQDGSEDKVELGAGRDLSDLLGRAMAGDASAVDALEAALTNDRAEAGDIPAEAPESGVVEPSAEARRLANELDPSELLEKLEREPSADRRLTLTQALFVAIGMRATEKARRSAGALICLRDRLAAGDFEAVVAARRWVATHIPAPVAEEES